MILTYPTLTKTDRGFTLTTNLGSWTVATGEDAVKANQVLCDYKDLCRTNRYTPHYAVAKTFLQDAGLNITAYNIAR